MFGSRSHVVACPDSREFVQDVQEGGLVALTNQWKSKARLKIICLDLGKQQYASNMSHPGPVVTNWTPIWTLKANQRLLFADEPRCKTNRTGTGKN